MDMKDVYYDGEKNEYKVIGSKPYREGGFSSVFQAEGYDEKFYT